jgi:hypothetical protein
MSRQTFENLLNTSSRCFSDYLGRANPNSFESPDGYYSGYSGSQQEVVMGAFLAAYTGTGVGSIL